ncbi:MAG TPA: DsbA family protein [Solirubrobacteraceae bacterium]|jgi:2-hydroxychromene-2-carboxylate isomerase
MAGSSTAEPRQPRFYFDLASPEAYLVAERSHTALGVVPEWVPVWLGGLRAGELGGFRCAEEVASFKEDVERRAARHGLQPLRWPEPFPADTRWAMLVATYALRVGRVVAFSQAAFRQAFAGGRDLGDRDSVLIAAAACEMHPAAVLKGASLGSIERRLDEATAAAAAAGVMDVPAVQVGDRIFHGDRELEAAAEALAR